MQKLKKGAFTLVELIVVITILAILGTIAFISLQGYSRDARDSKRTADLGNIKTSLELFSLKTGKYPSPDSYSTITYSGGTENVWYQGVVGDNVTINLKSLNEKPLDPLTSTPYTYSVTNSYKEYEVLALYEGSVAYNAIINQTNAAVTSLTPKIVGNYNGVFVKTNNYIIPVPSIVIAEPLLVGTPLELTPGNINSLVVTNGTNIPSNTLTNTQTGALNINLSVYTGSITKTSGTGAMITAVKQIQGAYSGTTLATQNNIAYILNQTTNDQLIALGNITILKGGSPLVVNNNTNNVGILNWMQMDPNCNKSDVIIGNQTWAGCNSTLGIGFERGKKDDGTNGGIAYCYNYSDAYNNSCTIFDANMGSNIKASDWFTSTTTNLDRAVNNIWGKLYTWTSLDTNSDNIINSSDTNLVCGVGYHIPSDAEWSTAEEYLLGSTCDTIVNSWNCSGVGWKNHSTTNSITSIVSKLGIPLAGGRRADGTLFDVRGYLARLWTSTSSGVNTAYNRRFSWNMNGIVRENRDSKGLGGSIRCIKD